MHWVTPELQSHQQYFSSYFNGGCAFILPEQYSNINILAFYADTAERLPAIIECRVGDGKAILSGVHLEIPASHAEKFAVRDVLASTQESRDTAFRVILKKLDVKLKEVFVDQLNT